MTDKYDELSQKIIDLDWDIQPEKDLWAGIENRLEDKLFEDKKTTPKQSNVIHINFSWKNCAIAASVLIGLSAAFFSALSLKTMNEIDQRHAAYVEHQKEQIELMEQQHLLVRAQLVRILTEEKNQLDPILVRDINASLRVIDSAAMDLKKSIMQDSANASYTSTLANTYQQEAEMLETLNYSRSNRI